MRDVITLDEARGVYERERDSADRIGPRIVSHAVAIHAVAVEQDRRSVAGERARIVAWLRNRDPDWTPQEMADRIERGDDQEGGGDGA